MIRIKCLVNGAIAPDSRARVVQGLADIYSARFGLPASELEVEFNEVDAGMWFTAGKPSRASMVLGSVPAGTTQALRVQLMDDMARMFSEVTGAPYHDVMVVAADPRPSARD